MIDPKTMLRWTPALVLLAAAWFGPTSASAATTADPDREALAFFENDVRPILAEHCLGCHGPSRQKGDLRLDSIASIRDGGHSGPAIDEVDPSLSLLVEAVRYEGLEMPPDGPLPVDQADAIVRWVELGAPWPVAEEGEVRDEPETFSAADRAYWAFQPVDRPEPPRVLDGGWSRNEIDQFVIGRLRDAGLSPAPEADRRTLIRRATFDLTGLPPTPEEVDAFLDDQQPDAFDRLVDRLLESPHYGERWGRYWLDLVRYAESDGYRADVFRPQAWRYRDFVVAALNDDMPYDEFVRSQVAGDELDPESPRGRVASGFLRLWTYESNQRDVEGQWNAILDDLTDVTADAFLGLGMGCARCHDHKYDPILQRDYYRLRSFYAGLIPRDDLRTLHDRAGSGTSERRAAWEALTAETRSEIAAIEAEPRRIAEQTAMNKFTPELQAMFAAGDDRSGFERQLVGLANRQILMEYDKVPDQLDGEAKPRWEALQARLEAFKAIAPADAPPLELIAEVGPEPPSMAIPGDRSAEPIAPGVLSIIDPSPAPIAAPRGWPSTSGRRTSLAGWLTDESNPLTSRVIVNRLWQFHFGRGIVATTSDFGRLGEPPSHPELLDWLASTLVRSGWSLKAMHRAMMTSATYRQASSREDESACRLVDAENALLWTMPTHRLEAEPIRDAMLAVSGELDLGLGGPSVPSDQPRRSIYTRFLRNTKDPILDAFDVADGYGSTDRRNVTTSPTQALLLINGEWVLGRAEAFADRLRELPGLDDRARVDIAYRLAFARPPDEAEAQAAVEFLGRGEPVAQADDGDSEAARSVWVDFCHVLLNANEFLYID